MRTMISLSPSVGVFVENHGVITDLDLSENKQKQKQVNDINGRHNSNLTSESASRESWAQLITTWW